MEITLNINERPKNIEEVFNNLKELLKLPIDLLTYADLEDMVKLVAEREGDYKQDKVALIDKIPLEVKEILYNHKGSCYGYECDFYDNQRREIICELMDLEKN